MLIVQDNKQAGAISEANTQKKGGKSENNQITANTDAARGIKAYKLCVLCVLNYSFGKWFDIGFLFDLKLTLIAGDQ